MMNPSENNGTARTVLLLGNRRQSLTVIRSLAQAGWRIIAAVNRGDDRNYHAHESRYVSDSWEHDDYRDHPYLFAKQLRELLRSDPRISAVFPVDEAAIRTIHGMRGALPPACSIVIANEAAIETCFDKSRMLELCNQKGVDVEPFEVIHNQQELATAVENLGYPCVIKPLDEETIWFGTKVAIVTSKEELASVCTRIGNARRRLMVQRQASGPRHNVYFAARNGELIGSVEVKIGRTDRVDGTGLAVTGQTVPRSADLLEDTTKLVKALDYSGAGCAQFIVCPDTGRKSFLEMNPRLGANFAVVHYAGLPLAQLAVRIASGEPCEKTTSYKEGFRFAWTYGELAGLRFELRSGIVSPLTAVSRMTRCFFSALTCHRHITWSWLDPLPTLLEFRRGLTKRAKSASGTSKATGSGPAKT